MRYSYRVLLAPFLALWEPDRCDVAVLGDTGPPAKSARCAADLNRKTCRKMPAESKHISRSRGARGSSPSLTLARNVRDVRRPVCTGAGRVRSAAGDYPARSAAKVQVHGACPPMHATRKAQ